MWQEWTVWDTENRTALVDSDNRLNFITTSGGYPSGWADGYEASRYYGSKWTFDLNHDFEFTLSFHYDHTGTVPSDEGGIEMGFVWFNDSTSTEPSHVFSLAADNWVSNFDRDPELENKNVFASFINTPVQETEGWWKRYAADGMFYASYVAGQDTLQLQALEKNGSEWESTGGSEYYGLKNELGLSELLVYFGGSSEGAALGNGNAYLQNFDVHKGTITPEPVGDILFLIGGVSLAVLGMRKKGSVVA